MQLGGQIQGMKELQQRFSRSPALIKEAAVDTLQVATFVAEGAAKENAPIDKGLLRGSIHSQIQNEGLDTIGVVGTNLEYAPYQEFGTGIYGPSGQPITPKRSSVLAFKVGGTTVFARSVAGTKPKRFMAKGLQAVRDNMTKIRDAGIKAVKKNLGF